MGGITGRCCKRGVRGLGWRPGAAGVLGRELRGAGVGRLRAIVVSVDNSDAVSIDLPVASGPPCNARVPPV